MYESRVQFAADSDSRARSKAFALGKLARSFAVAAGEKTVKIELIHATSIFGAMLLGAAVAWAF